MIRAFTTLGIMALLIIVSGLVYAPGYKTYEDCKEGVRVIANGVDLGCLKDGRKLSMWMPPNGLAPMKELSAKAYNDDWLTREKHSD